MYTMKHAFHLLIMVFVTIFLPVTGLCQTKAAGRKLPVTMMNTEENVLHSIKNGETYSIYVWLPDSYHTTDSAYSVLYLTDANQYFGLFTGLAQGLQWGDEMPESIVVGIAYSLGSEKTIDNKWSKWLALRMRDFTPSNNAQLDKDMGATIKSGGAALFLEFIETELFPFIEKKYRVKDKQRTYIGFSLGGLFGFYAMLEKPSLFQRFIVGSPSIWFENKSILSLENKYAQNHADLPVKLYVSTGSLEEEINAGMVRNMLEFTSLLKSRKYKNLVLKTDVIENETHLSSPAICFLHGITFLFRR